MFVSLAQSNVAADKTLFEPVITVFSKVDTLAHPKELLNALEAMGIVWSVIFLIAGIITLLHGYKFHKPVTIILAMLIGMFAGYALSDRLQAPAYIAAACLALLMGVLCFPLLKYAVAALGGLVGAFLGANMWTAIVHVAYKGNSEMIDNASRFHGVGALIGLMLCGMLAFILFKLAIVLFTSVSGSTVAVLGGLALLLQIKSIRESLVDTMQGHPVVIPLMVLVPAIIGLIMQQASPAAAGGDKKPAGKPAAA